jgi:hypothetical protein
MDSRTDMGARSFLHHLLSDALPFDGLSIVEEAATVRQLAPRRLTPATDE